MTLRVTVVVLVLFAATHAQNAATPNPASVNCEKQGGKLEIGKNPQGEVGRCIFADGSECDEWPLFRGECKRGQNPPKHPVHARIDPVTKGVDWASVECQLDDGKIEERSHPNHTSTVFCVFPDGSECEENTYALGNCKPGQNKPTAGIANPASVNCGKQGGTLQIRKDKKGNETGYCVFKDGSECEEWALFRGKCKAGQIKPKK